MTKVSIVIINYNTFDLTSQCIRSVIERTSEIEYEIILVDNNSSERDPRDFADCFPDLKLIRSEENLGFAKGNNLGISQASGEMILLLNSDTILINNAVKLAYNRIKGDSEIGVITGNLVYENLEPQPVTGRFPSVGREIFDLLRLSKFLTQTQRADFYLGTEADYDLEFETDWVWGSFFMFRREDLQYFPKRKLHDDFFMYYEDLQWCYHFKRKLRKKVLYSPDPKVIHLIGGSDKNSSQLEKYYEKILINENKWLAMNKGWVYAKLYYLIKGILYLTMRNQKDKAKTYLRFSFSRS